MGLLLRSERQLIRGIALKEIGTFEPASGREQDVMVVRQVDDRADVEPRVALSPGLLRGLMEQLGADRKALENLALHLPAEVPPMPVAPAGVDPNADAAVGL